VKFPMLICRSRSLLPAPAPCHPVFALCPHFLQPAPAPCYPLPCYPLLAPCSHSLLPAPYPCYPLPCCRPQAPISTAKCDHLARQLTNWNSFFRQGIPDISIRLRPHASARPGRLISFVSVSNGGHLASPPFARLASRFDHMRQLGPSCNRA